MNRVASLGEMKTAGDMLPRAVVGEISPRSSKAC
jgi:hypothetical protein